ncbi:MAG TPA: hypothetical protein VFK84_15550 [Burkholderiales bacterium]|nr:hypothetical protein [Burkholderiales bacterium]
MPLPILKLAILAGAGYYFYNQQRRKRAVGSQTNASEAIDDIKLRPNASSDEHLDAAVMETFPASDPVSSSKPSETAWERQQRLNKGG